VLSKSVGFNPRVTSFNLSRRVATAHNQEQGTKNSRSRSQKPKAKSQKPKAKSQKPKAKSQKPKANR
jgi:hypothetical protein